MIISNLIGIIADDLTGATDTALQFHLRGANTQILLNYEAYLQNIKNAQAWAISTETRNVTAEVAYEKVKMATQTCIDKLNLEFFYKKIDSTLRGNIAVETLAMLDVLKWDAAVILPAFPSEGRITVGGYHLLKGVPIERTELARDVHSPIFESHIPTLLRSQLDDDKKDIIGLVELSTVMNGAGLQLFSSKVFPWLGEKAGRYIYNNNLAKNNLQNPQVENIDKKEDNPVKNMPVQAFKGIAAPYKNYSSSSLRI